MQTLMQREDEWIYCDGKCKRPFHAICMGIDSGIKKQKLISTSIVALYFTILYQNYLGAWSVLRKDSEPWSCNRTDCDADV